jgi:RNA polymerase sigma-70 factor (ECF subfamily)
VSVTLTLDVGRVLELDADSTVDAARRGDAAAQASLFENHKQRVAHHVLRMTGDPGAVDDLVQEVFIAAFRRLPDFRGDAQLDTWLYRITVNKVRNWWDSGRRRKARERSAAAVSEAVAGDEPQQQVEAEEKLARLYDALGSLPAKFREAFVARALEGLSLEDASARLGVPVSTVSYRARRAEALLCESLGLRVDGEEVPS